MDDTLPWIGLATCLACRLPVVHEGGDGAALPMDPRTNVHNQIIGYRSIFAEAMVPFADYAHRCPRVPPSKVCPGCGDTEHKRPGETSGWDGSLCPVCEAMRWD